MHLVGNSTICYTTPGCPIVRLNEQVTISRHKCMYFFMYFREGLKGVFEEQEQPILRKFNTLAECQAHRTASGRFEVTLQSTHHGRCRTPW